MRPTREKPNPFLLSQLCKACGRCVGVCNKGCITLGEHIEPITGLIPVELQLDDCNGCGLCIDACPEPWGMLAEPSRGVHPTEPEALGGAGRPAPKAENVPPRIIPMPELEPLITKGAHAATLGALLGGCRHFYGYPITPSTEGAELMARLLPRLDGVFVQAVSEVATINYMFGCGAAGLPSMTFTSSPGLSLMLEGISYMIGGELPGVIVNVMRAGPGLGNIAPAQADIKLVCHGLGHGDTHAIVLAPSTPQEMLDLTKLAFELTFTYRNPVIVLSDGYLGQMTGKVTLPRTMVEPGLPAWAVWGDAAHRRNHITSILLDEGDQEAHNLHIFEKYRAMQSEVRSETYRCDDAEVLVIACNTPARMAKGAVEALRSRGVKAGLFRPITLWPFPTEALRPIVERAERLVVVEAAESQLADEVRLALARAEIRNYPTIETVQRYGGNLPQRAEIIDRILNPAAPEALR